MKRRSRRFWGIPAVRVAGKSPLGDSKTAPQADGSIARSPARWTTAQVSKSSERTNDNWSDAVECRLYPIAHGNVCQATPLDYLHIDNL